MPNLFPENYDEIKITSEDVVTNHPIGYKQSIYFDCDLGDFPLDGQGKSKTATGVESYEQWAFNCLSTEKGKFPYYPLEYGLETEPVFKAFEGDRDVIENMLRANIVEALMNDPYKRTKYVECVNFRWIAPDSVEAAIKIVAIYDATIDIIVTIGG